jgi:hypothetical protein
MTVYRLKKKQLGPKCFWCSEKAKHRGIGFGRHSCDDHIKDLEEWDDRESTPDTSDAAWYAGL